MQITRDISIAARRLARAPVFTIAVSALLAIGIGVNGAIVSIFDTAFLRKLPIPNPDRIVVVRSGDAREARPPGAGDGSSFPIAHDVALALQDVADFAAYRTDRVQLRDDFAGINALSAFVTGNYFSVMGVTPALGRFIASDEEQPAGKHPVVVISDHFWRSQLGGDGRILGRQLKIGESSFTIIGVAPPRFVGMHPEGRTDLWLPYTMEAAVTGRSTFENRDARLATTVGRLKTGVTIPNVQGRLDALSRELASRSPTTDAHLKFRAVRQERLVAGDASANALPSFLLVLAMVALLHLIACANVAALMLARAAARHRELGIRLCLGASPKRIASLLLTEAGLLAAIGAIGGIVLARWLTSLLCSMDFLSAMDSGLDLRLASIIALIAIGTTLQFGLLPAGHAARSDPLALVRGLSPTNTHWHRGRGLLIVGQVALSLVLLSEAAAMLRSFERQAHADPGFDAEHIVVASIQMQVPRTPVSDPLTRGNGLRAEAAVLYQTALARVAIVPGVERIASAQGAPFNSGYFDDVQVQGYQYARGESMKTSILNVGPDYFATIGASIIRGREFSNTDASDPARTRGSFDVAIVNESMARRYWPNADPIGKTISFRRKGAATVIGVVRDMHDVSAVETRPRVYFPMLEWYAPRFDILIRVRKPEAMVARIRSALVRLPSAERPKVRTLTEVREEATMVARIAGIALATCAAVGLLLTVIGLYGHVAMWAAERQTEIGIRIALGARAEHVHRLLLGGAVRNTIVGGMIGLALAIGALKVQRAWMGPVMSLETLPMMAAVVTLILASAIAAFLPSRRAASVPPADVIRSL